MILLNWFIEYFVQVFKLFILILVLLNFDVLLVHQFEKESFLFFQYTLISRQILLCFLWFCYWFEGWLVLLLSLLDLGWGQLLKFNLSFWQIDNPWFCVYPCSWFVWLLSTIDDFCFQLLERLYLRWNFNLRLFLLFVQTWLNVITNQLDYFIFFNILWLWFVFTFDQWIISLKLNLLYVCGLDFRYRWWWATINFIFIGWHITLYVFPDE